MKRLLVFLVFSCLFSASVSAEIKMLIAYENKLQFPYYMGNGETVLASNPGVAVELIQRLEHHIPEIDIHLVRYPWKRCLSELQAGRVDGIFNASFHPKRLAIGQYPWHNDGVDPSRRIATISYSLYKLRHSDLTWTGQDFVNLRGALGAPLGYSITRDLRAMNVPLEESGATVSNLKKLLAQRIEGVVLQEVTADYYLRTDPKTYQAITKVSPPIKTKAYYLMLSHAFVDQHPALAETIWDTLKMLRETEFDTIAAKYLK